MELQKLSCDVPEVHKIRLSPDFEALKIVKGPVGLRCTSYTITFFVLALSPVLKLPWHYTLARPAVFIKHIVIEFKILNNEIKPD